MSGPSRWATALGNLNISACKSAAVIVAVLCGLAAQPGSYAQTDAQAAFSQSLALRTDRIIADQTIPLMGWLAQTQPVPYTSQGPLRLKLTLQSAGADAKPVKELGETLILGGNLASLPFPISINVQGVPDGDYQYAAVAARRRHGAEEFSSTREAGRGSIREAGRLRVAPRENSGSRQRKGHDPVPVRSRARHQCRQARTRRRRQWRSRVRP